MGFDKYLNLNLKVCQMQTPLLRQYNIDPFIHANLVLAPNRNLSEGDGGARNFIKNYGRASFGFGAQMLLSIFSIEAYYSPLVFTQKNELRNEFQINIGID